MSAALLLLLISFSLRHADAAVLLSQDFPGTGNTTGLQYTDAGSSTTIGGLDAFGARREGSGSVTFYNLSDVSSGTVYFSVLFRQPNNNNWGGFSFFDGGTEKLFFGDAGLPFEGPFSIDRNGGSTPDADQSSVTIQDNQTYFLVGSYDFSTGLASLWVDPAFGPAIPAANLTVSYASGWTLTQVRTGGDATTDFDRIRVGTTWQDVVPQPLQQAVPEPASLALWSLGALGCAMGIYRRKRVA